MPTRHPGAKPAAKRMTDSTAAKPAAPSTAKAKVDTAVRHAGKLSLHFPSDEFLGWHTMDFATRIHVIRSGVPAQRVGELSSVMGMPKEALMDSLGLSRATIHRKVQRAQALSPEESERLMGVQALIGQVQAMIHPALAADFDAAKWLARWLAEPLPALGGETPGSYMDTVEGQKYIGNLLAMAQSGAYA